MQNSYKVKHKTCYFQGAFQGTSWQLTEYVNIIFLFCWSVQLNSGIYLFGDMYDTHHNKLNAVPIIVYFCWQALEHSNSSIVAYEIVLSVHRLVNKYGSEQQMVTWDIILDMVEVLLKLVEVTYIHCLFSSMYYILRFEGSRHVQLFGINTKMWMHYFTIAAA